MALRKAISYRELYLHRLPLTIVKRVWEAWQTGGVHKLGISNENPTQLVMLS